MNFSGLNKMRFKTSSIIKSIFFLFIILLGVNSLFAQEYERYIKLVDTTLTSVNLGYDKNITITVPFEWQEDINREFPVIVIFDQQNQRSHNYIINTIDYLTSNEQMPSAILISVESKQNYRTLETLHKVSNDKGLAAENEKFIFEELLTLAEQKYKASKFRLFIGHSRYGYFTTSLLSSRPDELNGVIVISPFFKQSNVDLTDSIVTLQKREFTSVKYFRYGIGNDYPDDFENMQSAINRLTNPIINAKGFLFKEADHNATPGLTIATSLYEIFEFWALQQSKYMSENQSDLCIMTRLSDDIQDHYGSEIAFSLGVLNGKGWQLYNEEKYEKAIEAWEIMMHSYPNFSEGYLYILLAQIDLGVDGAQTITKFKDSLSKSEIYDEADKDELLKELEHMME